jgi:hypothetical protein
VRSSWTARSWSSGASMSPTGWPPTRPSGPRSSGCSICTPTAARSPAPSAAAWTFRPASIYTRSMSPPNQRQLASGRAGGGSARVGAGIAAAAGGDQPLQEMGPAKRCWAASGASRLEWVMVTVMPLSLGEDELEGRGAGETRRGDPQLFAGDPLLPLHHRRRLAGRRQPGPLCGRARRQRRQIILESSCHWQAIRSTPSAPPQCRQTSGSPTATTRSTRSGTSRRPCCP